MQFPLFEAIMMVCFGFAWPVSILKSWRSRTNRGKSLSFLLIILIGYVSGLLHKCCWQEKIDGVIWLYILNTFMVLIDCALYARNARLERNTSHARP